MCNLDPYDLTERDGKLLILHARDAIAKELNLPGLNPNFPKWGDQKGASFVTLLMDRSLRGCIGSLAAYRGIVIDVRENAVSSAFKDPRFPPLSVEELGLVKIELSILTPLKRIEVKDFDDFVKKIEPFKDGVVVQHGLKKATFLPSVWEQLPQHSTFLHYLLKKGNINSSSLEEMIFFTYRVRKFREE